MAIKNASDLKGKVALITGASQGIGLAIARGLAQEGSHVAISARNEIKLKEAAKELEKYGVQVLAVVCNVRDDKQVNALLAAVQKKFGRLDLLVNNAGVAHANLTADKLPVDDWLDVIDTNLNGMFRVTRAALPLMQAGSTILNNLSVAAKRAFPGMAAYIASKHGGMGFTKTLREELRPKGIRVIALLPGAADSEIWDAFWAEVPREKMMSVDTVAQSVIQAVSLPANSVIEELVIAPIQGVL